MRVVAAWQAFALMLCVCVPQTSKVSTLVVTKSELQPWRRTALGRVTTTPLEAMSLHDQQQVAMYAVAKLQVRAPATGAAAAMRVVTRAVGGTV